MKNLHLQICPVDERSSGILDSRDNGIWSGLRIKEQ